MYPQEQKMLVFIQDIAIIMLMMLLVSLFDKDIVIILLLSLIYNKMR